jgi:hypothetical protein
MTNEDIHFGQGHGKIFRKLKTLLAADHRLWINGFNKFSFTSLDI